MSINNKQASQVELNRYASVAKDILRTFQLGEGIFSDDNFYAAFDSVVKNDRDRKFNSSFVGKLFELASESVNNTSASNVLIKQDNVNGKQYVSVLNLYMLANRGFIVHDGKKINAIIFNSVPNCFGTLCAATLTNGISIPLDVSSIISNIYRCRERTNKEYVKSQNGDASSASINDDVDYIETVIRTMMSSSNTIDRFTVRSSAHNKLSIELDGKNITGNGVSSDINTVFLQYGVVFDMGNSKPLGFLTGESMATVQSIYNSKQYNSIIGNFN